MLQACEAWRREAEDCTKRAKAAEDDRLQLLKERDEVRLETSSSSFFIMFLFRFYIYIYNVHCILGNKHHQYVYE